MVESKTCNTVSRAVPMYDQHALCTVAAVVGLTRGMFTRLQSEAREGTPARNIPPLSDTFGKT